MRKLFLAVIAATALVGCSDPLPVQASQPLGNGKSVDLLFSVDGCTVYRFQDWGYFHYFAKCEDADVTTFEAHTEGNGKTSHTVINEFPTSRVRPSRVVR